MTQKTVNLREASEGYCAFTSDSPAVKHRAYFSRLYRNGTTLRAYADYIDDLVITGSAGSLSVTSTKYPELTENVSPSAPVYDSGTGMYYVEWTPSAMPAAIPNLATVDAGETYLESGKFSKIMQSPSLVQIVDESAATYTVYGKLSKKAEWAVIGTHNAGTLTFPIMIQFDEAIPFVMVWAGGATSFHVFAK